MNNLKISVAIATYNGEKYIYDQIQSILDQSLLPDEIVISDDNSSDSTIEILKKIKKKTNLNLIIIENIKNKGYSKNFEIALSRCTGDLIFISDQDDYWFKNKISIVYNEFKYSQHFLHLNDNTITDKLLKSSGITKMNQVLSLYGNVDNFIPGCCMTLDNSYRNIFLPFPNDIMSYDQWLNFISITIQSKKIIYKSLQYYRLHQQNTSNFAANSLNKIKFFDRFKLIFKKLNSNSLKISQLKKQILAINIIMQRLMSYKNEFKDWNKYYENCQIKLCVIEFRLNMNSSNLIDRIFLFFSYFFEKKIHNNFSKKSLILDFLRI